MQHDATIQISFLLKAVFVGGVNPGIRKPPPEKA